MDRADEQHEVDEIKDEEVTEEVQGDTQDEVAEETQDVTDNSEEVEDTVDTDEESEDNEPSVDINSIYQSRYGDSQDVEVPEFDISQLQPDEDGTISAETLLKAFGDHQKKAYSAMRANVRNEIVQTQAIQADLNKVVKTYPEIAKDPDLFNLVLDQADASALRGENLTYSQAAERVAKYIGQSKQQGRKEAQQRTRVAKAADLSSSGNKAPVNVDKNADLRGRLAHDPSARQQLLKRMIEDGQIKT